MKYAFTLLVTILFWFTSLNAQICTSYRIENLNQVGTDVYFDLFINTTDNSVLNLGNSDFLINYNTQLFSNPTFTVEPGFCTFKPTDQSGNNIPLMQSIYNQNTSTDFIMDELIINVYGTSPGNQASFDLAVAIIDGSMSDHRLGRFKLTGFTGSTVEDAQIALKSDIGLFETTVYHVENDGVNFYETIITCSSLFNISLKALLEGPYDPATNTMDAFLNLRDGSLAHRGLLPGLTPLNGNVTPTPMGQPYDIAPWNYAGTEGNAVTSYPESVVDWVLISVRNDDLSIPLWQSAGWINEDGYITLLSLPDPAALNENEINVVIQHRNHFGICTPAKLDISSGGPIRFDFTTNQSRVLGSAQKLLGNGTYVMYSGDANQAVDAQGGQDINGNDNAQIVNNNGLFDLYSPNDLNFSGDITGADRAIWNSNNGIFNALPK